MKKSFLSTIVLSVSILALSLLAPSAAHAQNKHVSKSKGPAVESYMVIKITDENKAENKVDYKAISTTQFKDEQKRANDDYKQKMKEWHDLRKTDPNAPSPKRIKIQKIQSDYETMKVAQEYAEKLKKEETDKDSGDTKPKDTKK